MGEKGVGKLSRETPPPCEGEPMGALSNKETNNKSNSHPQKKSPSLTTATTMHEDDALSV